MKGLGFLRLIIRIWRIGAISATAIAVYGCAPGLEGSAALLKTCVLNTDQSATLMGKWPTLPIPVALQASSFNSYETGEIVAAVDGWNRFFKASLGVQAFDVGGGQTSTNRKPSSTGVCSSRLMNGTAFTQPFVIYKNGAWSQSQSEVIAITAVCRTSSQPLNTSYMGYMDLNYTNFFVNGRRTPDLRSILTHELGHLLGLDHSCTSDAGRTGFAQCNSAATPDSYWKAVMFPSVNFDTAGNGEIRRNLNANDQGRANCLYQ